MYRAFIAFLLLATPTSVLAADWRLINRNSSEGTAEFVDLDSITPRDGAIRTVVIYKVLLEPNEHGFAAAITENRINCSARSMTIFRFAFYDQDNRQLEAGNVTRPWQGPFPAETTGGALIDYTCSNGASEPQIESWGSDLPFEAARQAMRAQARQN